MRYPVALTAIFICTACAEPDPQLRSETPAIVSEKRIIELLELHKVSGMSYAKLVGCQVVETGEAGYAIVEGRLKTDEHTVFEAASLSKPVFAWLVMSLVEAGIITLDEPFSTAGFEYARIPDKRRYAQLTPRLVLMHRTGLPNWAGKPREHDRGDMITFEQDPGTTHAYSGEAYLLLQKFIEHKTGQSLQTLFEERLGHLMPDSTFERPLPANVTRSRGYFLADNNKSDEVAPFRRANAAYSLSTTASDYAQFLSIVCRGEGLAAETSEEMLRIQTTGMVDGNTTKQWRLGWEALTIKQRETVFHSGDNGNYIAIALYYPDNGEGYVVMTNSESGFAFINEFLREAGAGERLK